MEPYKIALFGESEKGDYRTAYYCQTLTQMLDYLGNPPPESKGLHLAVQSLLYHYHVLFFRVREEGFSHDEYMSGLNFLKNQTRFNQVIGICAPGLGDSEIIDSIVPICKNTKTILITTESDLYDYLTSIN